LFKLFLQAVLGLHRLASLRLSTLWWRVAVVVAVQIIMMALVLAAAVRVDLEPEQDCR
jgi:hypothetical protein